MGCFDYVCECGGKTCPFRGGQNGGDSIVIVEVPLKDGTTIFVKGEYDSYGAVHHGNCIFYPEQFQDFFKGWFKGESEKKMSRIFVAKRIWTFVYSSYFEEEEDENENSKKITECFPPDVIYKIKLGKNTISKLINIGTNY